MMMYVDPRVRDSMNVCSIKSRPQPFIPVVQFRADVRQKYLLQNDLVVVWVNK